MNDYSYQKRGVYEVYSADGERENVQRRSERTDKLYQLERCDDMTRTHTLARHLLG